MDMSGQVRGPSPGALLPLHSGGPYSSAILLPGFSGQAGGDRGFQSESLRFQSESPRSLGASFMPSSCSLTGLEEGDAVHPKPYFPWHPAGETLLPDFATASPPPPPPLAHQFHVAPIHVPPLQPPPPDILAGPATHFEVPGSLMHSLMQPISQPMPQLHPFPGYASVPGSPRCCWGDYILGGTTAFNALSQPSEAVGASTPLYPAPLAPPAVAMVPSAQETAAQGSLQIQELQQRLRQEQWQKAQRSGHAALASPAVDGFSQVSWPEKET